MTCKRRYSIYSGPLLLAGPLRACSQEDVTAGHVNQVAGRLPHDFSSPLWESVVSQNFDSLQKAAFAARCEGFSMQDIFHRLHDDVIAATSDSRGRGVPGAAPPLQMTDVCKASLCLKLACAEKCLEDGADEELQASASPQNITA